MASAESQQISIRIPKKDLERAEKLRKKIGPFSPNRSDVIRLAIHKGLADVEETVAKAGKAGGRRVDVASYSG
jgi:Arc/MetJ-type ribon-helix-helix transcriptional regulator